MLKCLLDENISPSLGPRLWPYGVDAIHLRDRKLLGRADHDVWRYAVGESRTVVTTNGADFRKLAAAEALHPGLVVIPSGGRRDEQLEYVVSAVEWVGTANAGVGFMNRYVEVGCGCEIVSYETIYAEWEWQQ